MTHGHSRHIPKGLDERQREQVAGYASDPDNVTTSHALKQTRETRRR